MMTYVRTAIALVLVFGCTAGQIRPTDVQIFRDTQVLDASIVDRGVVDRGVADMGALDARRTDSAADGAADGSASLDEGLLTDTGPIDSAFVDTRHIDARTDTAIADARRDVFVGDGGTTMTVGTIAITEIFPDPQNGDDNNGEWFEVWNSTDRELSFEGCRLEMNTGTAVMLSGSIAPNEIATFGNWPAGSDLGGFVLTHSYHRSSAELAISNSGNRIRFFCNDLLIEEVNTNTPSWPTQAIPGHSYALSGQYWNENAYMTNDGYSRWCRGVGVYAGSGASTEEGTPGVMNPMCP